MVVDQGLLCILRFMLRVSAIDAQIRLYTSDTTPAEDTVLSSLTEATFSGYAAIAAVDVIWPDPEINGDGEAETDGPVVTWEADSGISSPETIHGLYVSIVDETASEFLFMAYRFPDPVIVSVDGDQVQKKINWFTDQY